MAFFHPAQAGTGVFEFFEVHLYEKNLHFRCKIVLSSDKTPPSGKITCFSEFYGSDYHIKHIFGRFREHFFFIIFFGFFLSFPKNLPYLWQKSLHCRCKNVLSSDKTLTSGKITCFSEFYGSDYPNRHIFHPF